MQPPRLTFACELNPVRLTELFADGSVLADLRTLRARVTLMLSDLSSQRAAVVRQLNAAGVPVLAIPLLPFEEGYYFTADNPDRAAARYEEWKTWTQQHGLVWDGAGLDIEPDIRLYQQIVDNPWELLPMVLPRLGDRDRPRRAAVAYAGLVARIRAEGWPVENYQFPLIADERRTGSELLQRVAGLVDVRTDREVWMLYSSFMHSLGPGMLFSYGPEAQAIAVGSTGGGPDIPGQPQVPALGWEELQRDLLLARQCCDDLYIHSLEGCVEQGLLGRLRSLDWGRPQGRPASATTAGRLRGLLRATLWASAHPWRVLAATAASAWVLSRRRPCVNQRRRRLQLGRRQRRDLIVPLNIQTIRREPSQPHQTVETPNVSRPDPSGAVQVDAFLPGSGHGGIEAQRRGRDCPAPLVARP